MDINSTNTTPGDLPAAVAAAQGRVKAAPKGATNAYDHYKYASAEAIIQEAQDAIRGTGLAVLPTGSRIEVLADGRRLLHRTYTLLHGAQAMKLEQSWPIVPNPKRPDALDKAQASAATTSLAYFLRDLLLMPRVDPEDNMDAREDEPVPPKRTRSTPPAPPPQKHDPSWGDDRARFCAELSRLGTDYDRVASWAEGKGWGRPSGWTQQRRDKALGYLRDHPDEVPAREPGED